MPGFFKEGLLPLEVQTIRRLYITEAPPVLNCFKHIALSGQRWFRPVR